MDTKSWKFMKPRTNDLNFCHTFSNDICFYAAIFSEISTFEISTDSARNWGFGVANSNSNNCKLMCTKTAFWYAFSPILEFREIFHWNMFLKVQQPKSQQWFRKWFPSTLSSSPRFRDQCVNTLNKRVNILHNKISIAFSWISLSFWFILNWNFSTVVQLTIHWSVSWWRHQMETFSASLASFVRLVI